MLKRISNGLNMRNVHTEVPHNMYQMNEDKMDRECRTMGAKTYTYIAFVKKAEGKKSHSEPSYRVQGNIEVCFRGKV